MTVIRGSGTRLKTYRKWAWRCCCGCSASSRSSGSGELQVPFAQRRRWVLGRQEGMIPSGGMFLIERRYDYSLEVVHPITKTRRKKCRSAVRGALPTNHRSRSCWNPAELQIFGYSYYRKPLEDSSRLRSSMQPSIASPKSQDTIAQMLRKRN